MGLEECSIGLGLYVNRAVEDQQPPAVIREVLQDKTLSWQMEDIVRGEYRAPLTRYTQVFDELKAVYGMVVRGERLVIPEELQASVVQLVQEGHSVLEDSGPGPSEGEFMVSGNIKDVETLYPVKQRESKSN